jgi:hypothetical protein
MSKVTILASAQISRSAGDYLTVELFKLSPDAPATVLINWPGDPSVLQPTAKALAAVAAVIVRTLAEAQAELASLKARKRL